MPWPAITWLAVGIHSTKHDWLLVFTAHNIIGCGYSLHITQLAVGWTCGVTFWASFTITKYSFAKTNLWKLLLRSAVSVSSLMVQWPARGFTFSYCAWLWNCNPVISHPGCKNFFRSNRKRKAQSNPRHKMQQEQWNIPLKLSGLKRICSTLGRSTPSTRTPIGSLKEAWCLVNVKQENFKMKKIVSKKGKQTSILLRSHFLCTVSLN